MITLMEAAEAVCRRCPSGYSIALHMEDGAAFVQAFRGGVGLPMPDSAVMTLADQLNEALCLVNGFHA